MFPRGGESVLLHFQRRVPRFLSPQLALKLLIMKMLSGCSRYSRVRLVVLHFTGYLLLINPNSMQCGNM